MGAKNCPVGRNGLSWKGQKKEKNKSCSSSVKVWNFANWKRFFKAFKIWFKLYFDHELVNYKNAVWNYPLNEISGPEK